MKKKKYLFLIGLCAIGFCTLEIQAINVQAIPIGITLSNMPNEFDKIDLMGDLLLSVAPDAIEAGANDNSVYLHFNQSFGNVSIQIFNSMGNLTYSTIVNTSVQSTVIIPINSVVSGIYSVVLENANGYAEGNFEQN